MQLCRLLNSCLGDELYCSKTHVVIACRMTHNVVRSQRLAVSTGAAPFNRAHHLRRQGMPVWAAAHFTQSRRRRQPANFDISGRCCRQRIASSGTLAQSRFNTCRSLMTTKASIAAPRIIHINWQSCSAYIYYDCCHHHFQPHV